MFLTSEPTVTLEDSNVSIGTRKTLEDIQPVFPTLTTCLAVRDFLKFQANEGLTGNILDQTILTGIDSVSPGTLVPLHQIESRYFLRLTFITF